MKWKEMIENIKANGKADLHHTLHTIYIEEPDDLARSNDGYRRDAFYRFNETFQYFFDSSARIDTTVPSPKRTPNHSPPPRTPHSVTHSSPLRPLEIAMSAVVFA